MFVFQIEMTSVLSVFQAVVTPRLQTELMSLMSVFQIEVTSLCMCVGISATVSLFCLFAPKVYIVVFQPHKNVRQTAGTTSHTLSSMAFKTTRSLYGELSSLTYPVQNGSALRQSQEAGGSTVRWGEGDGGESKAEVVVDDFHDSLEDLSSDDMPDQQTRYHDLPQSHPHPHRKDGEDGSGHSLQFMDQSPDFCRAGATLHSSLAAGATVHSAAGDLESVPSSGTKTAGMARSSQSLAPGEDSADAADVYTALMPSSRQAEACNLAESYSEVEPDSYSPLALRPDLPVSSVDLLSLVSDALLDQRESGPSGSLGDKLSFGGESLLRHDPATRVSDSNLNRRNGTSLHRFRGASFGSCDNNKTSFHTDL